MEIAECGLGVVGDLVDEFQCRVVPAQGILRLALNDLLIVHQHLAVERRQLHAPRAHVLGTVEVREPVGPSTSG
jgi:hypothetical protein